MIKYLIGLALVVCLFPVWPIPAAVLATLVMIAIGGRPVAAATTTSTVAGTVFGRLSTLGGKAVKVVPTVIVFLGAFVVLQYFFMIWFKVPVQSLVDVVMVDPSVLIDVHQMGVVYLANLLSAVLALLIAVKVATSDHPTSWATVAIVPCMISLVYTTLIAPYSPYRLWRDAATGYLDARIHLSAAQKDVASVVLHCRALGLVQPKIRIPVDGIVLYYDERAIDTDKVDTTKAGDEYIIGLSQDQMPRNVRTNLVFVRAVKSSNLTVCGVFRFDQIEPYIMTALNDRGVSVPGGPLATITPTFVRAPVAHGPTVARPSGDPDADMEEFVAVESVSDFTVSRTKWTAAPFWADDRDMVVVKPVSGAEEDLWHIQVRSGYAKPCALRIRKDDFGRYYGTGLFLGRNYERSNAPVRLKLTEGKDVKVTLLKMVPQRKIERS